MRSPELLVVLALMNVPLYYIALRTAFDDWAELRGAVSYWLSPRFTYWLALLQGEGTDRQWSAIKLLVLCVILGLGVLSEYMFVADYFPSLAAWTHAML